MFASTVANPLAMPAPALRARSAAGAARRLRVQAASWQKAVSAEELKSSNKSRVVVELEGQKVLIQEFMGDVFAVSNKCPHLGLSLQGKTPLLSATVNDDGCIVCPAHGSAFDMKTGDPKGEWCPNMPELPFIGKAGAKETPLPVFEARVNDDGDVEVLI